MARLRRQTPVQRPADLDRFVADDWRDEDADRRSPHVSEFGWEFLRRMRAPDWGRLAAVGVHRVSSLDRARARWEAERGASA